MRKPLSHIVGVILLLAAVPVASAQVTVRGRVDIQHQYSSGPFPAQGARIELLHSSPNGWQSLGRYVTGSDGMYYFAGIAPGEYFLQVNGRSNYPIRVALPSSGARPAPPFGEPLFDVSPLLVRF